MKATGAIPTMYAGVQFRSRLEARWAAFFDEMKIDWQYEPVDMDGYIPDFVIEWNPGEITVEVKPVVDMRANITDLISVVDRAFKSGCELSSYMIVGATPRTMYGTGPEVTYSTRKPGTALVGCMVPDWRSRVIRSHCSCNRHKYHHSHNCLALSKTLAMTEMAWRTAGNNVQWKGAGR